jgi:Arc-like DNA binding dprotein
MAEEKRITFRLPGELAEQLETIKDQTGRSINAEIISRLQASIDAEKTMLGAESGDPYAMVLAATETIKTASRVIEQALLQISTETGKVKIEEDNGEYTLSNEDAELLIELKKRGPKAIDALKGLLDATSENKK